MNFSSAHRLEHDRENGRMELVTSFQDFLSSPRYITDSVFSAFSILLKGVYSTHKQVIAYIDYVVRRANKKTSQMMMNQKMPAPMSRWQIIIDYCCFLFGVVAKVQRRFERIEMVSWFPTVTEEILAVHKSSLKKTRFLCICCS